MRPEPFQSNQLLNPPNPPPPPTAPQHPNPHQRQTNALNLLLRLTLNLHALTTKSHPPINLSTIQPSTLGPPSPLLRLRGLITTVVLNAALRPRTALALGQRGLGLADARGEGLELVFDSAEGDAGGGGGVLWGLVGE